MISKRKHIIILTILFTLFFCGNALSATVTFTMDNTSALPSLGVVNGIEGFIWDFEGLTSASFAPGPAINASWFTQTTPDKPVAGTTQVESVDLVSGSPMGDGIIGVLTYTGTISWSDMFPITSPIGWEFRTLPNAIISDIILASDGLFDGGTVEFKVVPIPGSILLLGSGLVGLIGIARRKRS